MRSTVTTVTLVLTAVSVGCAHGGVPREEESLGYGSQSAENRTGAVERVNASELDAQHYTSVQEMLEGRVSGLEVVRLANGDVSLRIRGGSPSLLGARETEAREPLLIIDGMPVHPGGLSRALEAINPLEVDRVEILKDASSTAIYGSRGAHGVVLIALKRDH